MVFEADGARLASVHEDANKTKWFCYFTGFLEGIEASGAIEVGELEPLLVQCREFVENIKDADANDLLEDAEAELLDFDLVSDIIGVRVEKIDKSCSRSSRNRFNGFCAGLACDGKITLNEAKRALEFIDGMDDDQSDREIGALRLTLEDALEDGIIDDDESEAICESISKIVGDSYADTGLSSLGSVPTFEYADFEQLPEDLSGLVFLLTGRFSISPRKIIEDALVERGAILGKSLSKKINYLIIAGEGSRDWIETHQGHKIIKAKQLMEKSGSPLLLGERSVLRGLRLA